MRALAPVDRLPAAASHRRSSPARSRWRFAGLPLLYYLSFDFDPIHLRSPKVESVATLLDLQRDAGVGVNAVNVVAPIARRSRRSRLRVCARLPQVDRVMTLQSFVPDDQPQKLAAIRDLDGKLGPILRSPPDEDRRPTPRTSRRSTRPRRDSNRSPATRAGRAPTPRERLVRRRLRSWRRATQALRDSAQRTRSSCRCRWRSANCRLPAGRAGHRRQPAATPRSGNGSPPTARRACRSCRRAIRTTPTCCAISRSTVLAAYPNADRRPDLDSRIRQHHRARPSSQAGIFALLSIAHHPVDRAAPVRRRAADAGAAAARRRGDARDLRADRHAAQFRQHHRAAAAARRRRRLQDLLHHGVARAGRPTCCNRA